MSGFTEKIKKHKQPFIAAALAAAILLAFGIIQLVSYIWDGDKNDAEKLKERADRYFASMDFKRGVNYYNMALDADPSYEEIYVILYEYYFENENRENARDIIVRAVENTDSRRIRALYASSDYVIEWISEGLESHLRELLGIDGEIWRGDVEEITDLIWRQSFGGDFSDLRHFKDLKQLSIADITDFEVDLNALGGYTNLEVLNVWNCGISDLSPLSGLHNLTALFVDNNQIADISPLSGLHNLTALCVDNNQIADISPLAALEKLESFTFAKNLVTDISPLKNFPALKFADVAENPFQKLVMSDLEHIENIKGLPRRLPVDENDYYFYEWKTEEVKRAFQNKTGFYGFHILKSELDAVDSLILRGDLEDGFIDDLKNLGGLESLTFSNSNISDFSPLAELEKLTSLAVMTTTGFETAAKINLASLSALAGLKSLTLDNYGITDDELVMLSVLENLEELSLIGNKITDLSAIANMPLLRSLKLDRNLIEDISPLIALKNLEELSFSDNLVTDLSPLGSMELGAVWFWRNPIEQINLTMTSHIESVSGLPRHVPEDENDYYVWDWNSEGMKNRIADNLGVKDGFILKSMLRDIERLIISYHDFSAEERESFDLSDLKNLPNLKGVEFMFFEDFDLTLLSTELEALNLTSVGFYSCKIENTASLSRVEGLKELRFGDCNIASLSLSGHRTIESIQVNRGEISSLSLSDLPALTGLTITVCGVSDISLLSGLSGLEKLLLWGNQIRDITPLAGLTSIKILDVGNNNIADVTPLAGLTNLTRLVLRRNNISDITPLASLQNLLYLDLENNAISDFSPIAGLERLIILHVGENASDDFSGIGHILKRREYVWGDYGYDYDYYYYHY